jgi:PAS domain S-box-containing protein
MTNNLYFLSEGGEMGKLIREKDWTNTPLGDPHKWPLSLQTAVAMVLRNPFGMYIAWGHEYIQIYNDAYRPILGSTKHPRALGTGSMHTFEEIWPIIGPMFDGVMEGRAVGYPDFMFALNRNGFTEECYFDFSYSPIVKEDGEVGGVLVTVVETTEKKLAIEKLKTSEERFKAMADNIPNLAWMAEANGSIFWYNKKWYEYTGTTPEQMEGWGWQSVHDPEMLPSVLAKWTDSLKSGRPFEMIFPLKGSNGLFKQFLTRVLPVYDTEGTITQWFGTNTDISGQIEYENKIKESENRIRVLIDSAPFPIGVYSGENFIISMANQAMLNAWGKGNNIFGKEFKKILPELTTQGIASELEKAYHEGIPFHTENQRVEVMVNGQPEIFFYSYSFIPLFDASGKVYGVMNTAADVTELNVSKIQLQKNEESLRNTILQAPVAMCIFKGPTFIVELANKKMFELWGKSKEELLNKPIFEGLKEASGQGFEAILNGVFTTGETYSAHGVPIMLPRNGKPEQVFVNFVYEAYKESNGKVSGILAVAIEVTEQIKAKKKIEEAEEKARLAIDSAELGVYEIYYHTDEIFTDERFNKIWGFDFVATREQYVKSIYPEDLAIRNKAHRDSLISGTLNYQVRIKHKDAGWRWVSVSGKIIFDEKHCPLKLIGIVQDITDTKNEKQKIEEIVNERTNALEMVNQELQKSNAELAQFAYIASHDLQEPLRKISVFSQMLEEKIKDVIDEKAQSYFNKINSSAHRMHTLIRDVLTYSELGQNASDFEKVDLKETIDNLLIDFELLIEQKGATFILEGLLSIEAVKVQMSQLFGNLISNSLKYSRKDLKPVIKITCKVVPGKDIENKNLDASHDYLKIRFEDNGIGLKKEYAVQIFNIFQRLHKKTDYEGTGIGLAMCKKIVLNHAGDLNASESTENGAVINIFLPLRQRKG